MPINDSYGEDIESNISATMSEIEISDDTDTFAESAGPKEAPPKAEVSRKPPGANPPKPSFDKR